MPAGGSFLCLGHSSCDWLNRPDHALCIRSGVIFGFYQVRNVLAEGGLVASMRQHS